MIDYASVDAFVEKNAGYYAEKWAMIADNTSTRVHWNWAAAIGGIIWLAYRKLYLPLAIVLVIGVADAYVTMELYYAGVFPAAVNVWDKISYWVYAAVYGLWGNYWYFQKFRKVDEAVAEISVDLKERHSCLAAKGGTNRLIAGIFLLVISASAIWVLIEF